MNDGNCKPFAVIELSRRFPGVFFDTGMHYLEWLSRRKSSDYGAVDTVIAMPNWGRRRVKIAAMRPTRRQR
jgi:hypothetical protein